MKTGENDVEYDQVSLRTLAERVLRGDDLQEWFHELVTLMLIKFEDMPTRGSNWTLSRVNDFELHISW